MLSGQPSIWTVRWGKLPAVTWQMSSSEAEEINTCSMRQEHSPGHWRTLYGGAYRGWEVQPQLGRWLCISWVCWLCYTAIRHFSMLVASLSLGEERLKKMQGIWLGLRLVLCLSPFTVWLVSCLYFVQGWSWTLTTLLLPKCYLFLELVWSPVVIKDV